MSEVAAIIINRNTKRFLRDCIDSILEQDYDGRILIWVVDNGSTDGSLEMLLNEYPGVHIVANAGNVGYGRACNQGASKVVSDYLLFMNSDTVLSTDTVTEIVRLFKASHTTGIIGPRVLNSDGSIQYSCREFPPIFDAFLHAFLGLFRTDNPGSERYKKTCWDHTEETVVDWVSGCFMAVDRGLFRTIGGFDEGYFMYVEDVDICWAAKEAGWEVRYMPRGDVTHHIGMSSRIVPTRMVYHHHRSMWRFHRKTYRGNMKALVGFVVAAGIISRFLLIVGLNLFYRARAKLGGAARVIMPGRQ